MMTTGRAPTVGDLLQANIHLVVSCCHPECRHERRLSAAAACELLGPDTSMIGLERRLVCSACGSRGHDGFITARPCTLDQSAWAARERDRSAKAAGGDLGWDLGAHLATLRRLAGGELGGDGPVQSWVDKGSKGV